MRPPVPERFSGLPRNSEKEHTLNREREQSILVRVEEAARLLGIGRSTIYQMVAANELPGVMKIRGCLRIRRDALTAWVIERSEESDATTQRR